MYQLIRKQGFDEYAAGLASRFAANNITFVHSYSPRDRSKMSLSVDLQNSYATVQICGWESGELEITAIEHRDVEHPHIFDLGISTSKDFHAALANCLITMRDEGHFDTIDWSIEPQS